MGGDLLEMVSHLIDSNNVMAQQAVSSVNQEVEMRITRKRKVLFFLMFSAVWLFSQKVWAEETHPFVVSSEVVVTRGNYGTSQDTTVTRFDEDVTYLGEIGKLGLTIPYVFRKGASVTAGESSLVNRRTIPNKADGLGDIQLHGDYYWLKETESQPKVDLTGRIKFPTADEDKGLGTGKPDVGFGSSLSKKVGAFIPFADLEIALRNRPKNATIKSTRLGYDIGTGYPFTDQLTGSLFLQGATSSSTGVDAPLAVVCSGDYQLTEVTRINGQVLAGLTDGSPDFGAGAGLTYQF